jgi:hypothetical protein
MTKTTTCTYHCGACGLHFHSLNAFDAHRQGASNDPETGRHCVHPYDMDGRLTTLTEEGECRVYENADPAHRGEGIQHNVTIWTTAGYEQAGQRLRHVAESHGQTPRSHESHGSAS